ncbi:MAG: MBOAT family protein, partial [Flavobacteriales bacterium]|nr:MBOAT family protein [Flavobacteriales bacterium]
MYFNSFAFAVFLPVVWALYWSLARRPLWTQNLVILAASYFFYGWWDHRFLSLLILSSLLDFSLGRAMGRSQQATTRRSLLALSLVGNLGMLCTFKYFNFFAGSLATAFASVGVHLDTVTLDVVLPVGISFYTFQTLSYTIDVYRKQLEPATDPIGFFAYVAFFPQLVAGPIERATNLLPQFATRRLFDPAKATDGLRQILWGLFKKAVIADACAPIVDRVFDPGASWSGITLLMGVFLFAFQIYCDFSGYSDIAIGVARLFG